MLSEFRFYLFQFVPILSSYINKKSILFYLLYFLSNFILWCGISVLHSIPTKIMCFFFLQYCGYILFLYLYNLIIACFFGKCSSFNLYLLQKYEKFKKIGKIFLIKTQPDNFNCKTFFWKIKEMYYFFFNWNEYLETF